MTLSNRIKNGGANGRDTHGRFANGNKGGGRPTNEVRAKARDIIERPKVRAAVIAILENAEHPQFTSLWSKMAAYAYGQPAAIVEHSGPEGEEIEFRVKIDGAIDPL